MLHTACTTVTVINPNGDQLIALSILVEQAIAPDVVIGMGGTRGECSLVTLATKVSRWSTQLNVDLPYVN